MSRPIVGLRQTTRRTYQFGFVVAALGLAAWLPSVRPYIPVADDYALAERFTSLQAMGSWFRDNGIQRIGQFPTAWLLMRQSSLAPSLIALTLHISVCLVFFLVCARLLGPSPALAISSVFAAWPSGFEAILWTGACLPCLLSALVFWVSVLVVLETPKRSSHQFICGASIATLVLFTSAFREDFTFCYFAIPLLSVGTAESTSIRKISQAIRTAPIFLAPAVGAGTFIGLIITLPRPAAKHPVGFHLLSIFSVFFRQYSALDVFGSWFNPSNLQILIWQLGLKALGSLIVFSAVVVIVLVVFLGLSEKYSKLQSADKVGWFVAPLLVGASLLYVLAGGFSLDSRKKYGLMTVIFFSLGWLWCEVVEPRLHFNMQAGRAVTVFLCVAGVTTTWLVCALWHAEELRMSAIVQYLVENPLPSNVRVVSQPDLYQLWPQFRREVGFRFDDPWVLELALDAAKTPTRITNEGQSQRVIVSLLTPTGFSVLPEHRSP